MIYDTPSCGPIPPCPTKRLTNAADRFEIRSHIEANRSQLNEIMCMGRVLRKYFVNDPDALWSINEADKAVGDLIDHLIAHFSELERGYLGTKTDIYGHVVPADKPSIVEQMLQNMRKSRT